jgi:glycosyltransferase involved in cell wall biosynthesis
MEMKKINILHLIYSLEVGGAEKVIRHYADILKEDPVFNPIVCAIRKRGPIAEEIASLGVRVVDIRSSNMFGSLLKLIKLIIKEDIKIIHAHNPVPNIIGVPAGILTGLRKVIRTEHNIFYDGRVNRFYPILNAMLGLYNYRIVAVSDMVRDSHIRKDPFSKGKYITIHNGIKTPEMSTVDKTHYYQEFGIQEKSTIVGIIASLTEQKGHQYFIQMAEILVGEFDQLSFLIVGDGPLRPQIEELISAKGLNNRIRLTGVRNDIPALLQFMDIFVLSSLWEGFPMTIIEAMSTGKPIVVTDVGGNREAIIHGVTGLLIPPSNPNALAEAIRGVLTDESLAKSLGLGARRKFEKEFLASKMVEKTREIYKAALGIE